MGLTDQDLITVNGTISEVPFLKCSIYVTLTCEHPRYVKRRYLFVAAKVTGFFHLSEIEAFDGRLRSLLVYSCLHPAGTFSTKTSSFNDLLIISNLLKRIGETYILLNHSFTSL